MPQDIDILLIEDNQDDVALAIRVLKKFDASLTILPLEDGEEAIDFMFGTGPYVSRNVTHKPKMILMDLKMPKISGLEVLEKLKTDPTTCMIPVIMLSSSAEESDIKTCYELGANSYVVKPMDFGEYASTIGNIGRYWLQLNTGLFE